MLMSVEQFRLELGPDETGRMVDIATLRQMIADECFPFAKASANRYKKRYIVSREGFESWKSGSSSASVLHPLFSYMKKCQEVQMQPSWDGLQKYIQEQDELQTSEYQRKIG